MGNILSYFFPQPAPASIEQVEEVVQEEKTKEEIIEETVADAVEDVAVVEDLKTADVVVDKEIEAEVNNDEGFEVVEEATLSEISNSQHNTLAEEEPEISEPKVESPGLAFTDDIQTKLESQTDVAQQPSKDEELKEDELKMVEVEMALTSNIRSADVEVIGSIQDENIELDDQDLITEAEKKLEQLQETPVAVVPEVLSPEPIKAATPELPKESDDEDNIEEPERVCAPETTEATISPEVEQHKEVSGGVVGLKDILTEPEEIPPVPARVATPEPPKAPELKMSAVAPEQEDTESLTSELVKDACPEVEVIGSINDEDLSSPPTEPTKTEISENPKAVSPAADLEDYEMKEDSPIPEAPVKDASPEVEQQKEVEVSGGVAGLKDILSENHKFDE